MRICRVGIPGPDQAVGAIDAYVVFVAEHRDSEIDRLERLPAAVSRRKANYG